MKGQIGLYGGGSKKLDRALTIMTYDAWYDLSQNGSIGSHNVDILISDEAHRGTSERRVENIKGVFNEKTAQIAFTATAHFDLEKSVLASHEREIFYKSIQEAIEEGELAPVESQRLTIRIEPTEHMLSDEFNNATIQYKANYRRRLKQNTWNKYAFDVFKNGVNEKTGEPLSDNKTGFFVDGTTQADDLADMLNADEELQAKAEKLGCKGVAVAIHTKGLSPAEQKRRFDAYLAGEYMAIVGDEKFKEGFDYPPLKNIVDYPHSSVVDKAQILGRALRKWWNKIKRRYEGATIVDTAIYIGSKDPEKDEKLKEAALKNSVSVKSILGASYIPGPGETKYDLHLVREGEDFSGDSYKSVIIKRISQNSFHIQIHNENGEIENFTENDIDLPLIERINDVFDNPKLIAAEEDKQALIREIRINTGHLEPSVRGPRGKLFEGDPNADYDVTREDVYRLESKVEKLRKDDWVDITDEMLEELQAQAERTGMSGYVLFSKIENPPDGLNRTKAYEIVSGRQKQAPYLWIEALLTTYEQQPDSNEQQPDSKNDYQPISPQDTAKLQEEAKRTGMSGIAIFQKIENPPEGLDGQKADNIIRGQKSAPPSWVTALLTTYKQQPDAEVTEEPKLISPKDAAKLKAEAKRTGMSGTAIFQKIENPPEGLTKTLAANIVSGVKKLAPPSWVAALLSTYKQQPDAEVTEEAKPISPKDAAKLKAEAKRTGMSGTAIFQKIENPPEGLNKSKAYYIVSGRDKNAPPSWVTALLTTYKQQPDAEVTEDYELISSKDAAKLKEEVKRTKMSGAAIFRKIKNPPKGLNEPKANEIASGRQTYAFPSWVTALLTTYKQQPDAEVTEEAKPISPKDAAKLKEQMKRTKLTGQRIFNKMQNPPKGLDNKGADRIVRGGTKTAPPSWVAALLSTYEQQPDAEVTEESEPISLENARSLKEYSDKTGLGGEAIFVAIENPPKGLDKLMSGRIVAGRKKSSPPSYLKSIFQAYAKVMQEMGLEQPDQPVTDHDDFSPKR